MSKKLDALAKEFANPGATWRGMPFWAWNGELEEAELKRQVDVMKEMGFGGYFMHSRSGLITEYLGDEWFDLCNKVAEYGTKQGMESWLYDEDRWPSGSAGGIVTRDPAFRKKNLYVYEMPPKEAAPKENHIAAFDAVFDEGTGNLLKYKKLKDGEKPSFRAQKGQTHKVLEYCIVYDKPSNTYNGTTYIDTMMKAAVDKFLEVTHEQYRAHASDEIWSQIRGIFTDEPHRGGCLDDTRTDKKGYSSCPMFWTDDIFEEFRKRYGYDAEAKLPELFYTAPAFKTSYKIKHDYIDLGDNLFLERFAKPIDDWCKKNNILFTGHVLHEDNLSNQTIPHGSLQRFYEYMEQPGVDVLSADNYNYWIAKQIQSTARQLGQKRILSELYGCSGWQFNFKGHKNIGDWQALFGVNARCPHLSWYTMEGRSKRDYPASILHQSTYYKDYSYVEDYFSRFGRIMTEGTPVCDVLVVNPIESVWMDAHVGWSNWIFATDEHTKALEKHYRDLFYYLAGNQIDFDYGDEQMMAEKASVRKAKDGSPVIRFGKAEYRCAVISGCRTIRKTTLQLLSKFAKAGGRVVVLGDAPEMVDCVPGSYKPVNEFVTAEFSPAGARAAVKEPLAVKVDIDGRRSEKIYCQLRKDGPDGAYILALLNTDIRYGIGRTQISVTGLSGVHAVEEWSLTDGKRYVARGFRFENGKLTVTAEFEPGESRVYVLTAVQEAKEYTKLLRGKTLQSASPLGPVAYTLDEPNVLVIDYASAEYTGDDGKTVILPEKEVLRTDAAIRKVSGLSLSGGDGLQPWYSRKFNKKVYGDLRLTYKFRVKTLPEGEIRLAAERPEYITYYLNGTELKPDGKFWIDIALKTLTVPAELLRKGENVITAETKFRETTNVEAVYLLGNFGVAAKCLEHNRARKPGDRGNIYAKNTYITKLPKKLTFGNLSDQNLMFYSGCVSYRITPEMIRKAGTEGRLLVDVSGMQGALVRVSDNEGNKLAVLGWDPYVADVTEYAETGFVLTLVCTRKNTFGPLHLFTALPEATGPEHFTADGDCFTENYSLVSSRLGQILLKRV